MLRKTFAIALMLTLMLCTAASAQVKDLSPSCQFRVNSGEVYALTDGSFRTAWAPNGGNGELRIALPESGAAQILICWKDPPANYELTQYGADKSVITAHSQADDEFACITQLLPLKPDARYLTLAFSQRNQAIQQVCIYPEGELPKQAVRWEKPLDKCDLMVVSTHQDDEWLWFGAIIPYYDLVKDKDVQVVYMANCGRYRYQEALNGLAVAGVRTYPQFVGLTDRRDDTLDQAVRTWKSKDHILDVVVALIRRYKPEVILTHDWNGEYGHPQHILTSRSMEYAIKAAADPAQYPDSEKLYGAWQVKKLYRHLEKKNPIQFDWHISYPEFGGRTGLQVAIDSMNQHASQLKWYHVEDHGQYDNALFGLSYSTVGDDVLHEDLFENIPETAPTVEPTAEPTSEPTAEPAPTEAETAPAAALIASENTDKPDDYTGISTADATAEANETAAPEPAAVSTERRGAAMPAIAVGAAVIVSLGGGGALIYNQNRKQRKRRGRRGAKGSAQAKSRGHGRHSASPAGTASSTTNTAASKSRTAAPSAATAVVSGTAAHRHAAGRDGSTAKARPRQTAPAGSASTAGAPHTRREARLARRAALNGDDAGRGAP